MCIEKGDAVVCTCDKSTNYGRVGEVMCVDGDIVHVVYEDGEKGKGKSKYYKLAPCCEKISNKKSIMSSIIDFASNLVLSADEKLLRKYGLKNECGFTETAMSIVMNKLIADNQAYLIQVATAKQEEDNKNK